MFWCHALKPSCESQMRGLSGCLASLNHAYHFGQLFMNTSVASVEVRILTLTFFSPTRHDPGMELPDPGAAPKAPGDVTIPDNSLQCSECLMPSECAVPGDYNMDRVNESCLSLRAVRVKRTDSCRHHNQIRESDL